MSSLNLGGQTYAKQELLAILSTSSGGPGTAADASVTLARELITAKLNLAHGSDRALAASTIANADRLLRQFNGKLPYHVASSSSTRQKMTDHGKMLELHNNGSLTSGCGTSDEPVNSSSLARLPADAQIPHSTGVRYRGPDKRDVHGHGERSGGSGGSGGSGSPDGASNASSNALRPFIRKGVTALAFKLDGSGFASGSTDNKIRIWSAATGLQTLVLPDSLGLPTGLVFSPSDGTLSSVARDSIVRLWDAGNGSQLAKLTGHAQPIRAIAISPNGKFLASAGEDSRIMLWDLTSRKLSRILLGATNFVNALSFSPDSRLLASGDESARVLIFDVPSGQSLFTLLGHSGPVDTVAFSPDGTVLASGGQDTVIHLWNPASGQQLQALRGHAAPIETISFSPDGRSIASGGQDTLIMLWNTGTGVLNKTLPGSTGAINVLVFGSGLLGSFLASATDAGQITLWNVPTGTKLLTVTVPAAP